MWEPRRLTTLWVSMACCTDNPTFHRTNIFKQGSRLSGRDSNRIQAYSAAVILTSSVRHRVVSYNFTDVSEESTACIISVEKFTPLATCSHDLGAKNGCSTFFRNVGKMLSGREHSCLMSRLITLGPEERCYTILPRPTAVACTFFSAVPGRCKRRYNVKYWTIEQCPRVTTPQQITFHRYKSQYFCAYRHYRSMGNSTAPITQRIITLSVPKFCELWTGTWLVAGSGDFKG
jgi:hypothetical protein